MDKLHPFFVKAGESSWTPTPLVEEMGSSDFYWLNLNRRAYSSAFLWKHPDTNLIVLITQTFLLVEIRTHDLRYKSQGHQPLDQFCSVAVSKSYW